MTALEKAKELGQLLIESEEYKRFKEAEAKHLGDETAQEVMSKYNNSRAELAAEMRQSEMNEETLKEVRAKMAEESKKIMENDIVREYMESAQGFSSLIAQVNAIIAHFVKGEDDGCGGECGGCSGCS